MAKTLTQLKLRDDLNGRQVRCLILEKEGHLTKIKGEKEIKQTLASVPEEELVVLYEPTQAQRQSLFETVRKNTLLEDGELFASFSEEELFLILMTYTNIQLEGTKEDQLKEMAEVLSHPNPLFTHLKNELDILVIEMVSNFHELSKSYEQLPEELLEASNQIVELQAGLKEKEQEKRAKLAQIEQLKAEIERLEQGNE